VATKTVRTKKRCCKDRPRCKRCPVVMKRLDGAGFAERKDARTYVLSSAVRKKHIKAARLGAI
jgi:hypothetical protein